MNRIIIKDGLKKLHLKCSDEANEIVIFLKSNVNGAYGNFGDVILEGFDKSRDKIILVDLENDWKSIDDFKFGTWLTPLDEGLLLPFRNNPLEKSSSMTHSVLIMGLQKTKPFTPDLQDIDGLDVSLMSKTDFNKMDK